MLATLYTKVPLKAGTSITQHTQPIYKNTLFINQVPQIAQQQQKQQLQQLKTQ